MSQRMPSGKRREKPEEVSSSLPIILLQECQIRKEREQDRERESRRRSKIHHSNGRSSCTVDSGRRRSHLQSGSGSRGASMMAHCRICHEAEFESLKSLEAPCSCSGTVKYAHRDCIQRWCDEKGNTCCEICLQKYEPGYTAATVSSSKKNELLQALTIRDSSSFEIRALEGGGEFGNEGNLVLGVHHHPPPEDDDYSGWTTAADRTAAVSHFLVLTFTFLLLLKYSFDTLLSDTQDEYPFTITTVLMLRASGIIVPMYIIVRTIASLQKSIRRRYQGCDDQGEGGFSDEEVIVEDEEEEEEEQLHLV